jgi:hypothetical protein
MTKTIEQLTDELRVLRVQHRAVVREQLRQQRLQQRLQRRAQIEEIRGMIAAAGLTIEDIAGQHLVEAQQ